MAEKMPANDNSPDGKGEIKSPAQGHAATSETIDVSRLFCEGEGSQQTCNTDNIVESSLGKLLQALPTPALLVDREGYIVFVNLACGKISEKYESVIGRQFSSLFPHTRLPDQAQSIVEKVISTRKPQVVEGLLQIEKGALWARIHLRAFRIGQDRSVLVLVEHLARTRRQLRKTKKALHAAKKIKYAKKSQALSEQSPLEGHLLLDSVVHPGIVGAAPSKTPSLSAIAIGYLESGKFMWANQVMMDMFEEPQTDLWHDREFEEVFSSKEEFGRAWQVLQRLHGAGEPSETYARFKRKDGATFDGQVGLEFMDSDASDKRLVVSISEIGPQAGYDETVKTFEENFKSVYEDALDAVLIVEAESGIILSGNPAVKNVLGYEVETLVGEPFSILAPPDEAPAWEDWVDNARVDGLVLQKQNMMAANGSVVQVDLRAVSIPWGEESAVFVTFGEMSEEERVPDREPPALVNRYRNLIEGSPVGIFSCDAEGRLDIINAGTLKILGLSSFEEAQSINLLSFSPLVEAGVSSVVGKCLKTGEPVVTDFPHKIGLGNRNHSRLLLSALRSDDGTIIGAQAVIEDITEQKRNDRLLLQAERLKAVGEMAGGVAHSFNSTLQFVASTSRQALGCMESRNFNKVRPLLEQIFDSTRQAVHTVRRLQQFSRARHSRGVSQFSQAQVESFDLTEAVKESLERSTLQSKSHAREKGIAISLELDLADGCYIEGEESEIVEVVANLLKNSEEALPVGGTIKVKTFVRNGHVVLMVKDDGIGIPEKNLGRVFEPFWTTKDAHAGLGLTINFGIVRRHRGTLTVTSTMRRGTAFTVRLPYVAKREEKREEIPKDVTEQRLRILLVDDDEPIVRIFEKGLKRLGQKPFPAFSGQQGLKILEDKEVDAVVCDLAMPGMNGWEVARVIHQMCLEKGIPKPPFILLTGWAGQLAEEEILAHPDVDRIVEKPIKVSRLLEIVEREVQGASAEPAFAGRLDGIDLIEYMQLVMFTAKSMIVEVVMNRGARGLVYLDKGKICHATCGALEGEEAFYRCLNFVGGSFSNLPWREPERITVDKPGEYLLLEASRRRDEMKHEGRSRLEEE
ncbi:PAS domain S-box protein [Thermodesulfobacteriota bacterium]